MRLDIEKMDFPAVQPLFDSIDEAHNEMMAVVNEVCQQLRADGQPIPPFKTFYKDIREVWKVWSRYAPH